MLERIRRPPASQYLDLAGVGLCARGAKLGTHEGPEILGLVGIAVLALPAPEELEQAVEEAAVAVFGLLGTLELGGIGAFDAMQVSP